MYMDLLLWISQSASTDKFLKISITALSFSTEKPDVATLCIIGRRLLSLKVMFLNFNFGKHGDKNVLNITCVWN